MNDHVRAPFGNDNGATPAGQSVHETAEHAGCTLLSADHVKGTAVYNRNRDRIGYIETVMIDKRTGEVGYAVLALGSFLGIGQRYHPLPWDALEYVEALDGYFIKFARTALERAPSYTRYELRRFDYSTHGAAIDTYYGYGRRDVPMKMASS